jgi:photosynthetic reaction center H subunit
MLGGYDIAFISLVLFTGFFVGLILYLRREDRREGYPLEDDQTGSIRNPGGFFFFPDPKTFTLANGAAISVPNGARETRVLSAKRSAVSSGSPLLPVGDPMLAGIGPGSYAQRRTTPEVDSHGHAKIVPLRAATGFSVAKQDADPRGMNVLGCDGRVAGTVSDVWIDRPEALIRYYEVALPGGKNVLLPVAMANLRKRKNAIFVDAITAAQFANVPTVSDASTITLDEEERICAYYGGGYLYAVPSRQEALL